MDYSDDKMVCRCSLVTVGDVKKFIEAFPDMQVDQLKIALNIGTRCGSCRIPNSPNIDVSYEKVIEHYK